MRAAGESTEAAIPVILSGTRDELGGVDVGLANVFERPERPGGLTGLLVLPGGELVVGTGDEIAVGTGRFRLATIEPAPRGGYNFRFEPIAAAPAAEPQPQPEPRLFIAPIGGGALAKVLRAATPEIVSALGGDGTALPAWTEATSEATSTEWNGGEVGPNTTTRWAIEAGEVAASISLDIIRWSPDEVHVVEVAGWWRAGTATASLFARGDGLAPIEAVLGRLEPGVAAIVVAAVSRASAAP